LATSPLDRYRELTRAALVGDQVLDGGARHLWLAEGRLRRAIKHTVADLAGDAGILLDSFDRAVARDDQKDRGAGALTIVATSLAFRNPSTPASRSWGRAISSIRVSGNDSTVFRVNDNLAATMVSNNFARTLFGLVFGVETGARSSAIWPHHSPPSILRGDDMPVRWWTRRNTGWRHQVLNW
jgi:hypothetical protein